MPGPGGPGLTAADHILWTQRIHKEEINARSRPSGGFSVRAAVSVPDVPTKFKPGHMDPREASGGGFNPTKLGWDPTGPMSKEFRRCMNRNDAVPRQRHLFPETCQQEIGWIQGQVGGAFAYRSEPAGSKPTRLGVGWLMKDGHGGPINKLAAEKANDADLAAIKVEPEIPPRRSKDGNPREEAGLPPYAIIVPIEEPKPKPKPKPAPTKLEKGRRRRKAGQSQSQSKLSVAGQQQMEKSSSMPNLEDPRFVAQEEALGRAMDRSRQFLNCPSNHWYKPLSTSDVAKFADAYSKAWGVSLYGK